jgi:superfamily II RNA helicase
MDDTLMSESPLDSFLAKVEKKGVSLYPAQEEAILEIFDGKHVILNTPTGSGKSLVALAMHHKAIAENKRSFYTAPIKALVSEKFFALCKDFGAENVGMMTGDATVNRNAPIICCTAEILSNIAIIGNEVVDYAIVDEFHYYSDKDRGAAWQIPLLGLKDTTFLLMSATLGDTDRFLTALETLTGKAAVLVSSRDRPVPLEFTYRETPLHETIGDLTSRNLSPVYLVNFSQREAVEEAQNLMSTNFLSKEQKGKIADVLQTMRFDTPFGKDMQRYLRHGIGLHHAGLLPKYRLITEKLAQQGLLAVISGTDTLGVGVNVPIRTVLFSKLCKYDGEKTAILSVRDFHQISGRAGRKGYDDRGFVVAQAPEHTIENKRIDEKMAANPKKKLQKKKPPDRGYVPFDEKTFQRLIESQPETLVSQFSLSHGMVLSVLEGKEGYPRLLELIARSHTSDKQKKALKQEAALIFRSLRDAGVLEVKPKGENPRVVVHDDLQGNFSLNDALALWLVTALPHLDKMSQSHHLTLLSYVESTLESPRAVLERQLDKMKGEKMLEMKMEGIPFEERVAKLDEMEWPKPEADAIYDSFNAFTRAHPWLRADNIRPKSIARDMYERFMSFSEYVREYGLQRVEGVLLRYLSDVYKSLVHTVPQSEKTELTQEIEAYFQAVLKQTDTSLIDEWERLQHPDAAPKAALVTVPEESPAEKERKRKRALRSTLHLLVRALATKEWEDAASFLGVSETEIERAMQPFFDEHKKMEQGPSARTAELTRFLEASADTWKIEQTLVDPEAHNEWFLVLEAPRIEPAGDVAPFRLVAVTDGTRS